MYAHRFAPPGVSAEGYTVDETALFNERHAECCAHYGTLRLYRQIDYDYPNADFTFYPDFVQLAILSKDANTSYDGILCLLPCTTQKCKYKFSRSRDLITAVYVPIDIDHVKLRVRSNSNGSDERAYNPAYSIIGNEFTLDAQLVADDKPLDILLQECKLTPDMSRASSIESILDASRGLPTSDESYIHTEGAEVITINGLQYRRVVLIEPYIPLCTAAYTSFEILFDRNLLFYAEIITLEDNIRDLITRMQTALYTQYSSDPVIVVEGKQLFNYGVQPSTICPQEETIEESGVDVRTDHKYTCPSSLLTPDLYIPEGNITPEIITVYTYERPHLNWGCTSDTDHDDYDNEKMNDE